MNVIGELWADARRFFGGILRVVGHVLGLFLGAWTPPGWLRLIGQGLAALLRAAVSRPRAALALVSGVVLVAAGGGAVHRWYQHRPRPSLASLQVLAPPATDFREAKKPQPLRLRFSSSVAPLAAIRKEVAAAPPAAAPVTLTPALDGSWRWEDDKELTFTPRADWPVGQHFLVTLARKGLLADTARLERYQVEFESARFTVTLGGAEFYQDPTDPAQKQVVVTATFSHPVDAASFEAHLRATLTQRGDKAGRPLPLHVTYDKLRGSAAIHSAPIPIPERDAFADLFVEAGARAARGGPPAGEALTARVEVPGLYSFFHASDLRAANVDNDRGEPDQVLFVETSAAASEREIARHLRAWLLPVFDPADPDEKQRGQAHAWDNPAVVGDELRREGAAVKLEPIASEREFETVHSFRYHAPPGRWLYVELGKGAVSYGGYLLAEAHAVTLAVPELPQALRILGAGALVSLSGERKVPVYARDVPGVRFEIGRVLPGQIQHLVSQSSGRFERPALDSWRFGPDNVSELFVETRRVPARGPGKPSYLALDLQRYFDAPGGGQRRGLFLLKATAWDPERDAPLEVSDERLLLLTDLGLVVKDAQAGGHDLFVQSIHDGLPVAGASVQVLGRNGLPVLTATTDAEGHAALPAFARLERDRTPTLYLVRKGADESFLPVGRSDRYLDFSRFDIGGVHEREGARKLSAFLFSDRGIYRPGDEIHAGLIVKPEGWQRSLEGVPIQITVTDARGVTVQARTMTLDAAGFREIRQATQPTSPTGSWVLSAFIVQDGRPGALLGSTTVRVREFQPDRMKLAARLSADAPRGWVAPEGLTGQVTLENLFGTAAAGHRVRGRLVLSPGLPAVGKWRDYHFDDPLRARDSWSDDLDEQKTDDKGQARFDLKLARFARATYRLHFLAEGFEAEGGRSVSADAEVTVSPLPYLVGWKADGDLGYVSRGARRSVELVAISPRAEAVAVADLKGVLLQRRYVSVLTRQDNGTYKYQSVLRELPVSEKPLAIAAAGHKQPLASDQPGDFAWVVKNGAGEELARVQYTVAGSGNLARSLEKDAELQLALKSADLDAGGTLELSIKAPYAGAGLITIERDKVYAWKWFRAGTSATVETIAVPPELEGGGYVSVSLLRDINSEEVFTSPLSYGVLPFSISKARRTAKVTLTAPDSARPGEPYRMRYRTDRPARIVVFAVDEGILRVAGYRTPDPLALFFEKHALEVRTGQILDLVLPEFARLMAASAPGGDADRLLAAHLNPFKRRRDPPAAYWSGVLDAGPEDREVSYTLPDSFNGTLRVMAVAVAPDAIGTFEKRATVRGDFVISPNVPTFVAPGDEFEVTTSVANTAAGSGKGAVVSLALATGPELELVGPGQPGQIELPIPELAEGHATFRLRARRRLGSASLTFTATSGSRKARLVTDVSVRPPAPYLTTFQAGRLDPGQAGEARLPRNLYPEHRLLKAGVATLPLALAHGLGGYLEKFPHGCTEQLVSQGVPAMVLGKHPEFGFDRQASSRAVQKVIDMLATRQNGEGAFGLWAAGPFVAPVPSVWAVEFLLEARERGFEVPPALLRAALGWLQQLAASPGETLADERLRAQATYLLTRGGLVTSSFAAGIRKRLEAEHAAEWKQDAAAGWLAGTYALLHEDKSARALIEELRLGGGVPGGGGWQDYHDALTRDAQILYLIARHFPERARRVGSGELAAISQPIFQGAYNTLSSASVILALEAYAQAAAAAPAQGGAGAPRIDELLDGGAARALALPPSLLPWVDVSPEARGLRFQAGGGFPAFYVASQAGFDLDPPTRPIAERLEVLREYTDEAGKPVTRVRLGDEIQVHVRVRALGAPVASVALVDLLPGGFEVVVRPGPVAGEDAAPAGAEGGEGGEGDGEGGDPGGAAPAPFALPITLPGTTFDLEYGDVREDRVVLYGSAGKEVKELVYAIKATARGRYAVAPILGESMYDRAAAARGLGGTIEVVDR